MLRTLPAFLTLLTGLLYMDSALAAPPAPEKAGESKVTIEGVVDKKNKVDGDIDTEITNAKIRADSGSKSKWSMSTAMNYKGGEISRPFGIQRPNLSGLPETQTDTSLDASFRARYRPTKGESLSAGVSFGAKTPFHGDTNANENQVNVGDPFLGYNRTFAAIGLQNTWNILSSFGTSDESKNVDQIASVATDYTLMKAFASGLHIGVTASTWYNFFDTGAGDNKAMAIKGAGDKHDKRTEWMATVHPTAEFYINDTYSIRALFAWFRWKHQYGDAQNFRMLRVKEYQSLGVGVVVTRDIYLYPNVQFLPRDIRSDYTNVGFSATLNVF
ncbi:MAG TPA: hypothetical protein PKC28_09960 [Bdellovibrionales bacterium]|nr:hypothetical protein [Bdellovibrionales bacterium]